MKNISAVPSIQWMSIKNLVLNGRVILFTSLSLSYEVDTLFKKLNIVKTIYVSSASKNEVEKIINGKNTGKTAIAFGGGRVNDVARYVTYKWNIPIICIPTMISSDAFLVDCTGLRTKGCVRYFPSQSAEKVILDWKILQKTPLRYHISGCGDILSIYTGLYDWKYANDQKENSSLEEYSQPVAIMAKGILDSLLSQAAEIKKGTKKGIETILNCLAMEVELCYLYGNSRPEEGGEHFFAYCIENKLQKFLHGEMVAFGVLITSLIQGQDWKFIKNFLDSIGLNYKPQGLTRLIVVETLRQMREYVTMHKLSYSIYNSFIYEQHAKRIDKFFIEIGL